MFGRQRQVQAATLVALLVTACTLGSGNLIKEVRDVDGFDEIVLLTGGNVDLEVTGTDSLEIEADDNVMALLTSEVVDGRLELGSSGPFTTSRGITYTISARDLVGVTVAGSGSVDASGIDTAAFRGTISGSGDINPSGTCVDLAVTISGSGRFNGEELAATTGEVTVSGSGDAVVNVTDTLDVMISGSGDVRYLGEPSVDSSVSGSGNVRRR